MLQLNQVVRYSGALWRVDFVNDCRARIVPLTKSHVEITDDEGNIVRSFDRMGRGINISPDSVLDIVDDPERASDEMELARVERELKQARAELLREQARSASGKKIILANAAMPARAPGDWKPIAAGTGPAPPSGWHWHPTAPLERWLGDLKEGSLKMDVLILVTAEPGRTTKEIAVALADTASSGAVAACLDRFHKSGVLRRDSK